MGATYHYECIRGLNGKTWWRVGDDYHDDFYASFGTEEEAKRCVEELHGEPVEPD